jgi:Ran GTPase-activating protein (RanGAP) involved in mRNA processing and transport
MPQMIPKKSEVALTKCNETIHEIVINLTVSRLCLDIQILKSKTSQAARGEGGEASQLMGQSPGAGGSGDDYDELVVKKLDLSLEIDEISSRHTRQRVSDCVKYCPRWKSYTEKSTGLTSLIAHRLYHRMNGSGLVARGEVNGEEDPGMGGGDGGEDDPAGASSSCALLHVTPICRNYYRQVIRQLSEYHASLALLSKDHLSLLRSKESRQWRVKAYATCTEEEYQALVHSTPLSTAILHPEPEPVDVATSEEMSQLYQFFQAQHEEHLQTQSTAAAVAEVAALLKNDQIFDKGTLCSDGRLDLCKQVVGPNGVSSLMNSLLLDSTGKHQVQHLLLGNNICGDGLGEAVATFIKSGKSKLTTWYIAGNRLTAEGIRHVCQALVEDRQVTQLWLKRNPLHSPGAAHLAEMLRWNSSLLVLDLVNTGLLDEGGHQILSALSEGERTNASLQHLYLDGNGFTLTFAQEVARYFSSLPSSSHPSSALVTLSIGCNRFGNEGVEVICSSLLHNTTLQRLCLASVGMGTAGGHAVAALLRVNSSLRHLDLGLLKFTAAAGEIPNRIGTDGAVAIAHSLKYFNRSLFSLQLLNNLIFQAGMSALRSALLDSCDDPALALTADPAPAGATKAAPIQAMNQSLVRLDLEQMGVPFNELTREEIRLALRRNYLAMSEEQRRVADEAVVPSHLGPIQSVYRVNGSYTK